eukprot:10103802-Karenia_brevis.AAC.1
MQKVGPKRWKCINCNKGPGTEGLFAWLERSPCIDMREAGDSNTSIGVDANNLQRPQPMAATGNLHPTHHLAHRRGLVWCWKCGHYAATKP